MRFQKGYWYCVSKGYSINRSVTATLMDRVLMGSRSGRNETSLMTQQANTTHDIMRTVARTSHEPCSISRILHHATMTILSPSRSSLSLTSSSRTSQEPSSVPLSVHTRIVDNRDHFAGLDPHRGLVEAQPYLFHWSWLPY